MLGNIKGERKEGVRENLKCQAKVLSCMSLAGKSTEGFGTQRGVISSEYNFKRIIL